MEIDGNRYIDYVQTGASNIWTSQQHNREFGYRCSQEGAKFGAPTLVETQLAELIVDIFEPIEKVRFVSSGTEATMSAIRLARGYTHRDDFIKFEGCYHGHSDSLLVKGGSGMATFGSPSSPGVPADLTNIR